MFIVLEGLDKSGKTTQAKLLSSYLKQFNYNVLLLKDPFDQGVAGEIRKIILNYSQDPNGIMSRTETLLFNAARAQMVQAHIIPHLLLSLNNVVVCDRFILSTLAYQVYGNSNFKDEQNILNIIQYAINDTYPDITIFLDIPPKEIYARRKDNSYDNIEKRGLEYMEKVYAGYQHYMTRYNVFTVDARKSIDTIHRNIIEIIRKKSLLILE